MNNKTRPFAVKQANPPRQDETAERQVGEKQRLTWQCYSKFHRFAFLTSLQQCLQTPLATVMTLAVIAITLALPAILFVFLQNAQQLTISWDKSAKISLYLKQDVAIQTAQAIMHQLQQRKDIAAVHYISKEQGLVEFQKQSGLGEVLTQMSTNPLPDVIEIIPAIAAQTPEKGTQLLTALKAFPEVDIAQLDMDWVKRLHGLIALGKKIIYAIALLLALAVLLIVGNTMRLIAQNHHENIKVMQLIGGTNAFIRRPFLYSGISYGVVGALFAWLLVQSLLAWLAQPVQKLAALYQTQFALQGFDMISLLMLLLAGSILGGLGAWLSVNRYLANF